MRHLRYTDSVMRQKLKNDEVYEGCETDVADGRNNEKYS